MDANERERGITILAKNPGRLPGRAHQHRGCARSPGFRRRSRGGALHGGWSATPGGRGGGPHAPDPVCHPQSPVPGPQAHRGGKQGGPGGCPPRLGGQPTLRAARPAGGSKEQLDFAVVYASALQGWANARCAEPHPDLRDLFETILRRVPPPAGNRDGILQLRICALEYSSYVGCIGVERVARERLRSGALYPTWRCGWRTPGRGTFSWSRAAASSISRSCSRTCAGKATSWRRVVLG